MVSIELFRKIEKCISTCIISIMGVSNNLIIPVSFRTDMKGIAGLAYCYNNKRIELSEQLFLENIEEFLSDTIPHEVAHILTAILYPDAKQDHGPEWKSIMRKLGVNPRRCHKYDITSCFKSKDRIKYTCACDNYTHMLSKIRHERVKIGTIYRCNTCDNRLIEQITNDIY